MEKDMTQGEPGRLILSFTLPLLFGNLFQQLYNLMDTVIVGRFLGVMPLAAVGSTGSINFLTIGFCMGLCNGFAVPVAQRFGAKDESGMRRFVANSAWLSAIFAVIMTTLTVCLCRSILTWMKTPDDIFQNAYTYIVIIFAGIPVTFLYNMTSAIIRSMGDSKTPVYFLILAACLNIVLDMFFIVVLHMGVEGAAVATVLSQAVSGICCLIYMSKKYAILRMEKDERRPRIELMKKLIAMGFPMGIQYSVTAIGGVILQGAVNTLGSLAVASMTAAGKLNQLFFSPFDAIGASMATYTGQNMGAKKPERIRQGLKKGNLIGCTYAVAAFVFLIFFADKIGLLFVDASEVEILANMRKLLLCNGAFFIPLCLILTTRSTIQGMGYSGLAIFSGVSELLARAITAFGLVPVLGFTGVCFANPLSWIMANLFLIPAYHIVIKRVEASFAETAPAE